MIKEIQNKAMRARNIFENMSFPFFALKDNKPVIKFFTYKTEKAKTGENFYKILSFEREMAFPLEDPSKYFVKNIDYKNGLPLIVKGKKFEKPLSISMVKELNEKYINILDTLSLEYLKNMVSEETKLNYVETLKYILEEEIVGLYKHFGAKFI